VDNNNRRKRVSKKSDAMLKFRVTKPTRANGNVRQYGKSLHDKSKSPNDVKHDIQNALNMYRETNFENSRSQK
tara:strand:+ start:131 stop:349 length:219 start_codon:yes stop_codon:yes gene_type:complete